MISRNSFAKIKSYPESIMNGQTEESERLDTVLEYKTQGVTDHQTLIGTRDSK